MNDFEHALAYQVKPPLLHSVVGFNHGVSTYFDFSERTPHAVISGKTGIGKTVLLYNMILSVMKRCSPSDVKFVAIDGKGNSFEPLNNVRDYLLAPPIDASQDGIYLVEKYIRDVVDLLKSRTRVTRELGKATKESYIHALPHIVLVIDEFSSVIELSPTALENILFIAQNSHDLGIHLLLSNQRRYESRKFYDTMREVSGFLSMGVTTKAESDLLTQSKRGVALEKLNESGQVYYLDTFWKVPYLSDRDIYETLSDIANH